MSTRHSTSECTIDFPTSPAWFRTIRKLVTSAATQSGFSNREAGQVSMAVDEALGNIYRHGYMGSTEGRVRFMYKTFTSPSPKILIEIEDDAIQIDSELIRSRDLEDVKPGGLGVHLIQSVMNNATWTKRPKGGMKLSMSKTATNTHSTTVQSTKQ
jgi:anti-sigma regulatory factor (Ser/Thr protein kinase)|tara:strand:+ start:293 stop:760 length:468 start_codon:yes stop_codon:yes gene_type:complete